jgi:serine palmitoyltransferase
MPPLLAVSASEGINILRSTPSILSTLQDNIRTARAILDRVDCITIPSHPASPVIHICVRPISPATLQVPSTSSPPHTPGKPWNPASHTPRDAPHFDIEQEERLLQDVVDEALAQGVMITRAKRLRGQELVEPRPSIRLALTNALTRKETEKAVGVVKAALLKVLGKRR